jgi:hypothetical protein
MTAYEKWLLKEGDRYGKFDCICNTVQRITKLTTIFQKNEGV